MALGSAFQQGWSDDLEVGYGLKRVISLHGGSGYGVVGRGFDGECH